jgi:hypothetical protein
MHKRGFYLKCSRRPLPQKLVRVLGRGSSPHIGFCTPQLLTATKSNLIVDSIFLNFTVSPCTIQEIRDFVESHHYSHNVNGVKTQYCFKLVDGEKLIGAAIFAKLGMANVWKKYGDSEEEVLELRRLCCVDDTPKNTESWFVSRCIKYIHQNTPVKCILSYADPNYSHTGTIYKALNFEYLGQTHPTKMIKWGDKLYHDKTIRTYYNGRLKPYAIRIKDALDAGEAHYINQMGKHIFIYKLKPKRMRSNRYQP